MRTLAVIAAAVAVGLASAYDAHVGQPLGAAGSVAVGSPR